MESSIPFTHPLNAPNTIQTPSSLVDSLLDSYAVLLISASFKSCLFFTGWLFMALVIFGIFLHMFGFDLNIYGSYFKSIYHLDLHIHQFSAVTHLFPTMALCSHGDTIPLVLLTPYDNNSDHSESFQPRFIIGKVLQQFEKKIHCSFHHFVAIQGTDCNEFFTLWEGVCTYLFSFSYYVCISEYDNNNKHSYKYPTSLDDELQGVSPLPSCRFYTLEHDHRGRNLFMKLFYQKQSSQLIQVKKKIC